jgi:hypothetical protein
VWVTTLSSSSSIMEDATYFEEIKKKAFICGPIFFRHTGVVCSVVFGLKELSNEMDLAIDDIDGYWLVLGLNKGRGQFLNF